MSVIVPNWNGGELLLKTLAAANAQSFAAFETIVVDNGSTDGSAERAAERFGCVRLVRLTENYGFAAAVNAGVVFARGHYLAVLNSDAVPAHSWLAELFACLERHPGAACVDSKLLRAAEPGVLEGAGDVLTWSLKAYRRGAGTRDGDPRFDHEEQILCASGTAALWRRDAFEKLGGFDPRFFAYYEDVDLSLRARRAGYEIWLAPAARVEHVGGASAAAMASELESFYAARNRWATIVKNAPRWWLLRKAHVIAAAEVLAFARTVARGDVLRVLRAYAAVFRPGCGWWESRRAVQRTGELTPIDVQPFVRRNLPPLTHSLTRRRRSAMRPRSLNAAG